MGSQISTSVTIISSLLGWQAISLTNFDTEDEPEIAAGSKVEIAGAFFNFPTDESINASSWTAITTGNTAYIALTPAGTAGSQTVSASWTDTEPVWSTSKQGWYASASSAVRVVGECSKLGASTYRTKKIYITGQDSQYNNIADQLPYKPYGFGYQVGSALSITSFNSFVALAALSSTRIAYIDYDNDQLKTYDWIASAWSMVGSALTITGVGAPSLAALSSSQVAYIDSNNQLLTTYQFSGSVWSIVGSALSISGVGVPSLAALSSTQIAQIDSGTNLLRTYQFSGSVWSMVGSALTITGVGYPSLAALSSSQVACVGSDNDLLTTYQFSGSVWSAIGASLTITGQQIASIGLLSSTLNIIAWLDSGNDMLRTYQFAGSVWTMIGSELPITAFSYGALAALSSTQVVVVTNTSGQLKTYNTYKIL